MLNPNDLILPCDFGLRHIRLPRQISQMLWELDTTWKVSIGTFTQERDTFIFRFNKPYEDDYSYIISAKNFKDTNFDWKFMNEICSCFLQSGLFYLPRQITHQPTFIN